MKNLKYETLALGVAVIIGALSGAPTGVATALGGGSSSVGGGDPAGSLIVPSTNRFGYALTRTLALSELGRDADQNVFVSPFSASIALQMLLNGAGKGSATYTELAGGLNLGALDLDTINQQSAALLAQLQTPQPAGPPHGMDGAIPVPFTLSIANSAWSDSSGEFKFSSDFLSTLASGYDATARVVDFNSPSGADAINQWASDKTQGRIQNVVNPAALAGMYFVLMNATYFKANWQNPFDVAMTASDSFTRGDGGKSAADFMSGIFHGYSETANEQVMELPYASSNASMYVVLPKPGHSIGDALNDENGPLSSQFWDQVGQNAPVDARFSMPKFGFSSDLSLNDALQSLGIATVFTPAADLSRVGAPAAHVSLVKQNTFVKVDEMGTEAAAVTTIISGGAVFTPVQPPEMKVDRPFVVSIVEKGTGAVLFLGVISSP